MVSTAELRVGTVVDEGLLERLRELGNRPEVGVIPVTLAGHQRV